jgi:hypothetical protein
MTNSIFISHASEDADTARQMCAALESAGMTCWIAPRNIRAGADYRNEILRGIRETDAFLLVYSKHASASEHVAREVGYAYDRGKGVYPVRVDSTQVEGPLEYLLQGTHWVDYNADPQGALAAVAEGVKGAPLENAPQIKGRTPRRKRRLLVAGIVGALAVIGIGGFFGQQAVSRHLAVQRCDSLAGSELALQPGAGPGVPFGMIQPGPALEACRQAVAVRPNDAVVRLNYLRALSAATPAPLFTFAAQVKDALSGAIQAGSHEAVVIYERNKSDLEDIAVEEDVIDRTIETLTALALGDERASAAYLIAQMPLPMCAGASHDGPPPTPRASEQALFTWGREQMSLAFAAHAQAWADASTPAEMDEAAQASGVESQGTFCSFLERSLVARASAGGLLPAQLDLSDASGEDIGDGAHIETRSPDELLQLALAADYAPALFYDLMDQVECGEAAAFSQPTASEPALAAEEAAVFEEPAEAADEAIGDQSHNVSAPTLNVADFEGFGLVLSDDASGSCQAERAEDAVWRRLVALGERGYRPAMSMLATMIVSGCAPYAQTYADARRWLERASAGMEFEP